MSRRSAALLALLLLFVGGLGYVLFFWKTDARQIRDRLSELAEKTSFSEGINPAIYAANIRSALRESCTKDATFDIQELGGTSLSMQEVESSAAMFPARYQSARIDLAGLRVDVKGKTATAEGQALLSATQHGGAAPSPAPRVERRYVRFDLAKTADGWKISHLSVGPP